MFASNSRPRPNCRRTWPKSECHHVQGMDRTRDDPGGRDRESPVAAAELHDVPAIRGELERRQDGGGIEEPGPHLLVRHAAFTNFHGRVPPARLRRPPSKASAKVSRQQRMIFSLTSAGPLWKSFSAVANALVTCRPVGSHGLDERLHASARLQTLRRSGELEGHRRDLKNLHVRTCGGCRGQFRPLPGLTLAQGDEVD